MPVDPKERIDDREFVSRSKSAAALIGKDFIARVDAAAA